MSDAELLALAEREYGFLTDDNYHCAAAIMQALAYRLRDLTSPSFEEIKAPVVKPSGPRDERPCLDE